jgi:hypothetical protein
MANTFRTQLDNSSSSAMRDAMALMGGSSIVDTISAPGFGGGVDKRQQAIDKASAWTNQGVSAFSGMGDTMSGMGAQAMGQGLQMKASDAAFREQKKAAKAQQSANTFGNVVNTAANAATLLMCERRLKDNITPLPAANAWEVVRDLPLYSFTYKGLAGPVSYGPMIDEVEPLDPSLVKPTLLPPDEAGEIRGFDIVRHQAYESAALQQALQRIEQLEERLARLEAPLMPPVQLRSACSVPLPQAA